MPHRSYLDLLSPIIERTDSPIKGLAHITGGGFLENIPRILPKPLGAIIRLDAWETPPLFRLVKNKGNISENGDVPRIQHGNRYDRGGG